jgi:uncharacterized protein with FMN-binding domain
VVSSQRYDNASTGNGRNIAVAVIATASGVAALFAYHTSPGHADAVTTQAMTAPEATGAASMAAAKGSTLQTSPKKATPTSTKHRAKRGGTTAGAGAAGGNGGSRSITGKMANTRWGIVQVKITVQNGKIVAASAPVSPNGSQHSLDINQNAIPILNQETVRAGSAKIDAVSGATVTSGGYVQSLQSAIDTAHLA